MTSREFRERVIKRGKKADVQLTAPILEQLEAYYRLLARWNEKINLTALPLKDLTDQAVDRLLIEPLAAARYVPETALVRDEVPPHIDAVQKDLSGCWLDEPHQHLDGRRFSRTIWPEVSRDFSGLHTEADFIDDRHAAIALR